MIDLLGRLLWIKRVNCRS